MSTTERDDMQNAKNQAQAQYDSIVEMTQWLDEDLRNSRVDELNTEIDEAYDEYTEAKQEAEEEPLERDEWLKIEKDSKSPIGKKAEEVEELEEMDDDSLRERIQEDPLSVQVRSGWHNPGEPSEAEEYEILLCTGGPAVRIVGDLDRGQPTSARLECQDWFKPWTDYIPRHPGTSDVAPGWRDVLLTYAQQFYFGE